MNKQFNVQKGTVKSLGIEWTHRFGLGSGYTWNPVGGCKHACRWNMPDGSIARCYAEDVANGVAENAYPQGFEHHYWKPNLLTEPLKHTEPAGIFLDSMSDLMGSWVPAEEIETVFNVCRQTPQHTYFLLTKNAPRLEQFTIPSNVWVGVSAPPSIMFGKPLSINQQKAYLLRAFEALRQVDVSVKWLSAEPLSFDISELVKDAPINWCVIGAASNGRKTYQPDPLWVTSLISVLHEKNAAVFFKGNLAGNPAAETWLEEYPLSRVQLLDRFDIKVDDCKHVGYALAVNGRGLYRAFTDQSSVGKTDADMRVVRFETPADALNAPLHGQPFGPKNPYRQVIDLSTGQVVATKLA